METTHSIQEWVSYDMPAYSIAFGYLRSRGARSPRIRFTSNCGPRGGDVPRVRVEFTSPRNCHIYISLPAQATLASIHHHNHPFKIPNFSPNPVSRILNIEHQTSKHPQRQTCRDSFLRLPARLHRPVMMITRPMTDLRLENRRTRNPLESHLRTPKLHDPSLRLLARLHRQQTITSPMTGLPLENRQVRSPLQ